MQKKHFLIVSFSLFFLLFSISVKAQEKTPELSVAQKKTIEQLLKKIKVEAIPIIKEIGENLLNHSALGKCRGLIFD